MLVILDDTSCSSKGNLILKVASDILFEKFYSISYKKLPELFCLRNHVNFIKKSYLSDLVRVEKVFVAEAREGDATARLLLVQSVEIVQKIFQSHSLKRLDLHLISYRKG